MKRMLTCVLILVLIACFSLPAFAARAPIARAVYPAGEAATLEGTYQVVKATKKAPAYAALKLFTPAQFVNGEAAPVTLPSIQLMGTVNPAYKGKHVRVTGIIAASDGTGAFLRPFALQPSSITELPKPASVSLNDGVKKVTLNLGAQLTLKAEVKPAEAAQALTFTSSAKKIASVSPDGVVTALKKGTATITAKAANGKKATVKVTVAIPVTGIKLSPDAIEFAKIGATKSLKATVEPANATNKAVAYASSDEKVATVTKKGVVKAVGAGAAVISATTADGGLVGTCNVSVNTGGSVVSVTGVSVSPKEMTLEVGREAWLNATVTPSNATNQAITWRSDNDKVATVTEYGMVTTASVGTATITVETVDGKFTARATINVVPRNLSPYEYISVESQTENFNLLVGQTDQLTLSYMPETMPAPTVRKWISSNPAIASVNATTGVVTANAPGATFITADTGYFDEYGNYAAWGIPVYVTATPLTTKPIQASDFAFTINGKTVNLSTTLSQFTSMFPGGEQFTEEADHLIYYHFNGGSAAFDLTSKRVISIGVDTSAATTPRNLKLGATTTKVFDLYGLPDGYSGSGQMTEDTQVGLYYSLIVGGKTMYNLCIDINSKTQMVDYFSIFWYSFDDD